MSRREVVKVYFFVNGMVMAFDGRGYQVPAYQGRFAEVVARIAADWPGAEWNGPVEMRPGQARELVESLS